MNMYADSEIFVATMPDEEESRLHRKTAVVAAAKQHALMSNFTLA